ncbi:MAG: hybrid sensor histidine kinase/response regulator [Deltaproteobacteria bacterium]|nr:hybrid sensor histidine kinase/response regulator [Deltaproteobacteria bacterium]
MSATTAAAGIPRRAAVVDDDRLVRQLVRATLEARGYQVLEGESGAAGLRLAREPLDVLLLDLNMPDINGLAVCRAIRGSPAMADVPIMFLTASHDERTVVSCLQAGANDYISKPFAEAILQARVDMVVRAHRAERGRRRALEELSTAYEALKESRADAALNHRLTGLGVLASGLAHEMNSPLGALLSCLDYVVDDPPDPEEAKVALHEARQSAAKIAELVKRMKAIAGTGERRLAFIDLKAQCESISRVFTGQPVRLVVKGDSVVVAADASELHQALMSLVENAVQAAQHASAGRVDLAIGTDGDRGIVTVDDNGPGIDAADLPFIFDPFFTKKRLWTTPGLGLSIARAAAHRHGGDLRIEAHGPLGGARAVFSIPLQATSRPG